MSVLQVRRWSSFFLQELVWNYKSGERCTNQYFVQHAGFSVSDSEMRYVLVMLKQQDNNYQHCWFPDFPSSCKKCGKIYIKALVKRYPHVKIAVWEISSHENRMSQKFDRLPRPFSNQIEDFSDCLEWNLSVCCKILGIYEFFSWHRYIQALASPCLLIF